MPGQPFCSIIVPTHARPAQLRECVESLARLDYPHDRFEVVVVDDGGGVPLEPTIGPLRHRLNIVLLTQSRTGPAGARNAGAAHARGELLVFTDDDCVPRPDWLGRLVDRYRAHPGQAVGGLTVNALVTNPFSSTAQMIIDVGYAHQNGGGGRVPFFTTNNMAVPADGFRLVGGFDPTFTTAEDRDFCARWVAHGLPIVHEPEAVVEHAHDLSLWQFCRLHFAYGRGAFRFHREQARRGYHMRIAPSYYAALARRALASERPSSVVLTGTLLVVWHLTNTAGFVWEWVRGGRGGRSPPSRIFEGPLGRSG